MMNETFEERVAKYLAGESNASEKEALEGLLREDQQLQTEFHILKKIWELKETGFHPNVNVDAAWARFSHARQNTPVIPLQKNRTIKWSWAVAATLLLAFGAALVFRADRMPEHYTFESETSGPVVLSDGSRVYLNKGSNLYAYSFSRNKRVVELKGEAFFEVQPDASKPFIVQAGNTVTEVVGTSFNIDQSNGQTLIFVESGKVIFRSQENESLALALTSGEAAVYENEKIQPVANPSPNVHAWHSRELHFKEMPLSEAIAEVEAYFNQKITIENENVRKCRVTFTLPFKEPQFNDVVKAIASAVNADVHMQDQMCVIKGGNNCPQ